LKLLCDEGVERQVVEALRVSGHDVMYVAEMSPGISDDDVLQRAAAVIAEHGAKLVHSSPCLSSDRFASGAVPSSDDF